MLKLFIYLSIAVFSGFIVFQSFRTDFSQSACFSTSEAGFDSGAALSSGGKKTSLDIRLSLLKSNRPLNFDVFVFVNKNLYLVESKIYLTCNKTITRSIALNIKSTDSVSVVFTRHIQNKKNENIEVIRTGQDFKVESRLLSNIVVVRSGNIFKNDYFADTKTAVPATPVLSTVTKISSPINEFGGVIRHKTPNDFLAVTMFNDTRRTIVYNLVCLQDDQQIKFSNDSPLMQLKIEPKRYVKLQLNSDKLIKNELALVHCYSIYSRTLTSKNPIEVSPIWAAFVFQGNLK
jgi:hypothetical protein